MYAQTQVCVRVCVLTHFPSNRAVGDKEIILITSPPNCLLIVLLVGLDGRVATPTPRHPTHSSSPPLTHAGKINRPFFFFFLK